MAKVAFLGLGVMGFPMAGHLVKKGGHEVTVYNRTAAKAKEWADKFGGHSAPTPKAAAEGQDFVICCVGNDNDLRSVTLGADGAFAGMKKGATSSTTPPLPPKSRASSTPRRPRLDSSSSMRRCPAARRVRKTAC
jgi:3-hydroxyisobutyrate dehydrogenase-like beta-hydroxyacid dehydrogenase